MYLYFAIHNHNNKIIALKNIPVQDERITENEDNTLIISGPALDEDDEVEDSTNGNYWSAAAKVYNKGAVKVTTAITGVVNKKNETAADKTIYWEGTAASLLQ